MPSLTSADLRDDIRTLADIDKRHRFLSRVEESWFDDKGLAILTERAGDGTPLVGVMLNYPSVCPVDATATMQIQYWVANMNRKGDLGPAWKANIQAIYDEMVRVGARRVWGAVPKRADHLTVLLDPIATAGKCERIDGATAPADEQGQYLYENFFFYVGDGATVNDYVQGRS